MTGGTTDPFPPDVLPDRVELVIDEDDAGNPEVWFDGELSSSFTIVKFFFSWDISLEASVPVEPADTADCSVEWSPPTGTIELNISSGGHVEGDASQCVAYCDSATALYDFEFSGDIL